MVGFHAVTGAHASGGDIVQPALEHGAAQVAEVVGEHFSVKVVHLMLGDAGEESVNLLFMEIPVLVIPAQTQ